jgi:HlyD family secretion protein
MLSKTFISEVDISKIKDGQPVKITIDAFPDKSFTGTVFTVANIGEELPNTNDKVFEVNIKLDYTDPALRPSMTTSNKIILRTVSDAVFLPIECIHASADSIPFVYTKNGNKQIVIVAGSNDKFIRIEQGLKPGTMVYATSPEDQDKFRIAGEEFIPVIKERERVRRAEIASTITPIGDLD